MRKLYSIGFILILLSCSVLAIDYYPNTIIMNKYKNITNATEIWLNDTPIDQIFLKLDTSNDPLTDSLEITGNVTPSDSLDLTSHYITGDGKFIFKDLLGFSGYDFRWPDFMGFPGETYMVVGNIIGGYGLEVYQPMKVSVNDGLIIYNEGESESIGIRADNVVYNGIISSSGKDLRLIAGGGSDSIILQSDEVECSADLSTVGSATIGDNFCVGGECTNILSSLNQTDNINNTDINVTGLCMDDQCISSFSSLNSTDDWVDLVSTQEITGSKTFSNLYTYFGSYIDVGYRVRHGGDVNTYVQFGIDQADLVAGGLTFFRAYEGTGDKFTINELGVDMDFLVESDDRPNALHLDAGSNIFRTQTGIKRRTTVPSVGDISAESSEYIYMANSSGAAMTVSFEQADKLEGSVFVIKDYGGVASSYKIIINPYGDEQIDGLDTYNITTDFGAVTILALKECGCWQVLSNKI